MNEFKICNICKEDRDKTLKPKLQELDPEAKIIIACQGFCAIGATKEFCIVNGIPVIADTEEELINKVKEQIEK